MNSPHRHVPSGSGVWTAQRTCHGSFILRVAFPGKQGGRRGRLDPIHPDTSRGPARIQFPRGEAGEASVRALIDASPRRLGLPAFPVADIASFDPKDFAGITRIGFTSDEDSPDAVPDGIIARLGRGLRPTLGSGPSPCFQGPP